MYLGGRELEYPSSVDYVLYIIALSIFFSLLSVFGKFFELGVIASLPAIGLGIVIPLLAVDLILMFLFSRGRKKPSDGRRARGVVVPASMEE